MVRAFVAIGSNINPEENIRKAIQRLSSETRVVRISTVYRTEPEGKPEQPLFYNLVVQIETDIPPRKLKYEILRGIESELGRQRTEDKYAPRTIDLDLIIYDDIAEKSEELILPDPQILHRSFLAFSLSELSPDLVLSGLGVAIEEVIANLRPSGMEPMSRFTDALRKEISHGSES